MNEADIPIDIHYNKLLDWLLNRRHCQKQWQAVALEIRQKINLAIQDMPPVDEITRLLHGTYINYFHCQRIIELLKQTEDGSKNIFGRYSSQRMKDWQEIIALYEKDGVYLAEAAQMLARNVNYEIPALKRQVARCQQAQTDCSRKEGEYASTAAELRDKYYTACRQMGIQGKRVKTELLELVRDLPLTYSVFVTSMLDLLSAAQFYIGFSTFLLSQVGSGCESERLPLLCHVIEHGNTTTYEWLYKEKPDRVEEPPREYSVAEEDEHTGPDQQEQIDWGDFGTGADAIDFGDEKQEEDATSDAGIDWGGDMVSIEVIDDNTEVQRLEDGGMVTGSDALTILDNPQTRNQLINEIMELQSFLSQRLKEMTDDSSLLTGSQFQSAPTSIQIDTETVQDMLGKVDDLVLQLTSKRMHDLFLIRSSPRYVERLADSLKKILSDSEKAMSLSRLMVLRREEGVVEEEQTTPKLKLIRSRTRELQRQIEKEVSKKYKNRKVNIMGEINTV